MRKLEEEYREIYEKFQNGLFVVKTGSGPFTANSPDMRLEQTIQRSKKRPSGIIGQTRRVAYVSEWELVHREILAISNCFNKITFPDAKDDLIVMMHHELPGVTLLKSTRQLKKSMIFLIKEEIRSVFLLLLPSIT